MPSNPWVEGSHVTRATSNAELSRDTHRSSIQLLRVLGAVKTLAPGMRAVGALRTNVVRLPRPITCARNPSLAP